MLNKRQEIAFKIKALEGVNEKASFLMLNAKSSTELPADMARKLLEEARIYMDELGSCKVEDLKCLEEQVDQSIEYSNAMLEESNA